MCINKKTALNLRSSAVLSTNLGKNSPLHYCFSFTSHKVSLQQQKNSRGLYIKCDTTLQPLPHSVSGDPNLHPPVLQLCKVISNCAWLTLLHFNCKYQTAVQYCWGILTFNHSLSVRLVSFSQQHPSVLTSSSTRHLQICLDSTKQGRSTLEEVELNYFQQPKTLENFKMECN